MSTEQPDEWSSRPLPEPSGTRDTWRWTITRPADLTAARTGLRRLVTTGSVPSGAGPDVDRDPALGGLGLRLVWRLSSAFGWAVVAPRKHVWAILVPA